MGYRDESYDDVDPADETCPDGFCPHWSCLYECDRVCKQCGVRCGDHVDGEMTGAIDHAWVEPDA